MPECPKELESPIIYLLHNMSFGLLVERSKQYIIEEYFKKYGKRLTIEELDSYIEEEIRWRNGIINGRRIINPHLFDGVDENIVKEKLIEYKVYDEFLDFVRKAIKDPFVGCGAGTDGTIRELLSDLFQKAWNKQPNQEEEFKFLWMKRKYRAKPPPDFEKVTGTPLIKLINIASVTIKREMEIQKKEAYTINKENTVDSMSGYAFEDFMKYLFEKMGYMTMKTQMSSDMGADLILHDGDKKIVVQLKNHTGNIGVKAIQEIVASVNYYEADDAMVVITSNFTPQAITLARSNDVKLIDRMELDTWILKYGHSRHE